MNPNRMFPLALAAVLSPVLAVPASTSAAETLADWAWDRTGATCLGALSGDSADWDGSSRCLGDRLGGLGRATWLAATVAGLLMSFFRRNSIAITAAVLGFIFARAVKRASARRSADHAEIRLSPLASRLSATGRTIAQPSQFGQCGPVRLPIQRLLGLDDVVQVSNQDRQAERLPRVRSGGQLVECSKLPASLRRSADDDVDVTVERPPRRHLLRMRTTSHSPRSAGGPGRSRPYSLAIRIGDLEPERSSYRALLHIQRDEPYLARSPGGIKRRGDMPQVCAAQVAGLEHLRELGSQRPIRQDPFDTRHDGLREAALFTRVRRPQLGFEQIRGQQNRKRTQSAPQCGTARLAKGDRYQCGGIDVGNGHSFRSARNRSSAPGRSVTGAGGFHGLPERTSAPRRSSSSSRSSIVSELRGIGRISATGSPRRDTVTVFPSRTWRMISENRALASCMEYWRFMRTNLTSPTSRVKRGMAAVGSNGPAASAAPLGSRPPWPVP